MTDADFIAWLKTDSRVPCILVETVANVGGVETTRYLSNTGYTTGAGDVPANTHYIGIINDGGKTSEQLSLAGGTGMAFGDLELDNANGEFDAWLNDIWVNRVTRMYFGDQRWARSDFRLVFDGITADLGSRRREVLNLQMRDKLQRLNTTVTETKLGGTTSNADRLQPLTFGEVSNVEPLLVDYALLKYQVHQGAMESIIEVRDNGVPVSSTNSLGAGTFVLTATPAGVVTVSVQGDKPGGVYSNTVSKLVQRLATGYGTDPFAGGDLDAANLAAFDAANPQPVGVYLADRDNVLSVCQQLADSVGAQVVTSAAGLLQLIKIALPVPGGVTPTPVVAQNMADRSLEISERETVRAAVKIGYCRNYTVQTNLQTGIPPAHKDLFAQEWMTSTKYDAGVAATYKLSKEPPVPKHERAPHRKPGKPGHNGGGPRTRGAGRQDDTIPGLRDQPNQEDTLLLVTADADAEATRRLTLWKTQRTVYRYTGMPELLLEQLGGYQTITHSRFGLAGGVTGQIISIERDWIRARVTFEVLI
jgi:hypothetical protein